MDLYYLGYIIAGAAILLCIIIAMVSQVKVQSAYSKYSKIESSLKLTGKEFADKLIQDTGVKVGSRKCNGTLTDNYDPRIKTLNISSENYDNSSIASQAIVAHEFGHAMQHARGYFPLKLRQFAIKLSQFASGAFLPLLIVGIILEIVLVNSFIGNVFIYCVAGFYGLSVLLNLVTVPVEYNASKRAKQLLRQNAMYTEEEMVGVNEVLDSAALTYVASLLISLAYFARILIIFLGNNRR